MEEAKKSFLLHRDLKPILDKLTDEQAGKIMKAIFYWHEEKELPELDFALEMVMLPLINQFKRDAKKWNDIRVKRSEAGKKGGRPRGSKAKKTNASFDKQKKQSKAKKAVSVSGSVSGNVKKNSTSTASGDAETSDSLVAKSKRRITGKRLETFLRFWESFAYKRDRASAIDAWLDIPQLTNSLVDQICNAATREARARPSMVADGRTPKMAQGWLSARRWEDEVFDLPTELDQPKPQTNGVKCPFPGSELPALLDSMISRGAKGYAADKGKAWGDIPRAHRNGIAEYWRESKTCKS